MLNFKDTQSWSLVFVPQVSILKSFIFLLTFALTIKSRVLLMEPTSLPVRGCAGGMAPGGYAMKVKQKEYNTRKT